MDVVTSIEGVTAKNKYLHDLLYRATSIIVSTGMNGKEALKAMRKAWPIEGVKDAHISDQARKTLENFRKMDAIARANDKLNGRP